MYNNHDLSTYTYGTTHAPSHTHICIRIHIKRFMVYIYIYKSILSKGLQCALTAITIVAL